VDHVACLIVDVRLPGMTGIELWRRLKTARRALPTVIISAHERPTMSREEASEPVTAFVRKPFAVKALLDAIRGTLAAAGDRFDDDSSRGGSVG
jgi:FixJ family two-component response regulator